MSGLYSLAIEGNCRRYHMLRATALGEASTGTIRNLVPFNPNAPLKYLVCQLPTSNVIVETSFLAASKRAKLAACRQMPEGCREEDTAQIKICMAGRCHPNL